jgi:hypothetical protein
MTTEDPRSVDSIVYHLGGGLLKKKLKRLLLSERGDSSYISSFVYILVAVVLIAFILNVFHIISAKQEMDHIADQLVKQIQLNGGTSGETDSLFAFLSGQLGGVPLGGPLRGALQVPGALAEQAENPLGFRRVPELFQFARVLHEAGGLLSFEKLVKIRHR